MFPVPTLPQLANYTGRPQDSFTGFADAALIQATVMWTALTEITDPTTLSTDDNQLAQMGIMSMADYIYLRQPYQQVIAAPFMNETVGSYSYGKAMQEMARNAQAAEVLSEATGVTMFDLSVRLLAQRTRAGGVFTGGITMFERISVNDLDVCSAEDLRHQGHMAVRFDGAGLFLDRDQDRWVIKGASEFNRIDFQLFDMNTESFPQDP